MSLRTDRGAEAPGGARNAWAWASNVSWERVAVLFLAAWVSMTLVKELGIFDSALEEAQSSGLGATARAWLGQDDEEDDGGDIDAGDAQVLEQNEDSIFVYKTTVLDEIVARSGLKMSLEEANEVRTSVSSLPRTSSREYNVLQKKGEKYLIYSASGGFNNQLICLLNAIHLAKRTQRTLIVPPFGAHSNMYRGFLRLKQDQIVPMDTVLDFPYLEKLADIKLLPMNVTLLEYKRSFLGGGSAGLGMSSTKDLKVVRIQDGNSLISPKDPHVFIDVLNGIKSGRRTVYIYGRFFTPHWVNHKWWRDLRFSPFLQDIASTVADEFFDNKFNAFHIRLGDYETRARKRTALPFFFVKTSLRMSMDADTPIYVASEAQRSSDFFAPLLGWYNNVFFMSDLATRPRTLKKLVDFVLATPSTKVRNDIFGLVEQLICARAQKWVGTRISTFSHTIKQMRQSVVAVPGLLNITNALTKSGYVSQRLSSYQDWKGVGDVHVDNNIGPRMDFEVNLDWKRRVQPGSTLPLPWSEVLPTPEELVPDDPDGSSSEHKHGDRQIRV